MKNNNSLKSSGSFSVAYVARIGILAAVAAILMYIPPIKIPIMPSFISLDFSDFPALLSSFAMGPVSGVLVCLLKNLIHMPASGTSFIGELSNFLLGCCFVIPAGLIYKHRRNFKNAVLSSFVGSVSMAIGSFVINFLITYPLYYKIGLSKQVILGMYQAVMPSVDSIPEALIIFNVPFTFFKGLCSVLIVFLIYKRISKLLKIKK